MDFKAPSNIRFHCMFFDCINFLTFCLSFYQTGDNKWFKFIRTEQSRKRDWRPYSADNRNLLIGTTVLCFNIPIRCKSEPKSKN